MWEMFWVLQTLTFDLLKITGRGALIRFAFVHKAAYHVT